MDPAQPTADTMAAIHFRAEDLARRTVEFHRVREAEHRSRERFGRRFTPFPWSHAVAAVLADEALEDEASVVELIRELGRQGCSEVALAALDLVLTRGSPAPTKAMFDAAIMVCATEYQDQRCLDQLSRMRSLGLSPDLGTANLVLTGLCCRGRLEAAVELMGEMRAEAGIRPNSYSVLMILQACNYKRRGAYRQAIDAVQALEAGGRTANEEVVEALLQVCEAAMRAAPSFEAALSVFAALAELHLADSTRVYNGLLGAAGRAGRWREAQALYGQMVADEVPASLETHTALIQACVVGRALDHALHIFEHLVAGRSAHEAVPASIATYNHLIHACHQAGMLEKALEIASWVQKTGVEFDDETYGELMATIDVAQLWDDKAMKQARQQHKVVVPCSLRPAPFDAMRVLYLDHLESLQQEELLALEKLGGLGSWAPMSLTRGSLPGPGGTGGPGSLGWGSRTPRTASSVSSSARSLARSVVVQPGGGGWHGWHGDAAGAAGYGNEPYSAPGGRSAAALQPTGAPPYSASGQGHGLTAPSAAAAAAAAPPPPIAAWPPPLQPAASAASGAGCSRSVGSSPAMAPGGPQLAAAAAAAASGHPHPHPHPPHAASSPASHPQSRAASVKTLFKTLSSRPPAVVGGGPLSPGCVGRMSFRSPGAAAPAAASPPAAPTGFHEPPTWALLQTLDAATAGPGGTPFAAALPSPPVQGGGGAAAAADGADPDGAISLTLTLAVEPANLLYSHPSAASLGGSGASRTSLRSLTAGHGGGGGNGLGVTVTAASGGLPPLGEASSPVLPLGAQAGFRSPGSPGTAAASGPSGGTAAGAATAPPPIRQRSRAAPPGGGAHPPHPHPHPQPHQVAAQGHDGGLGGGGGGGAALAAADDSDFAPYPLPALPPVSASLAHPPGGHSRRFTLAAMSK